MLHSHYMEVKLTDKQKRRIEILDAYKMFPDGASDREIAMFLGRPDLNYCKPRISEMVDEGKLVEKDRKKCQWTGKTVRVCARGDMFCKGDFFQSEK